MNRDLAALESGRAIELLDAILVELQAISRKLDRAPDFVDEVHAYVGSVARFTAADLIASSDPTLAAAIAGRTAGELGRVLAAAEGREVRGKRLTREGKGVDGVVWCFR